MTAEAPPSWPSLRARYSHDLVTALSRLAEGGGPLTFSRAELEAQGNFASAETDRLLAELVATSWLSRSERLVCKGCSKTVPPPLPEDGRCPSCRCYFVDCGEPLLETIFLRDDPPPRLVDWVLTLHGMNTRGAWQEKLSWLLALTYGQSVPVAVYKYGIVRPGVLLRWRQRQLCAQVARRIRSLVDEAEKAGRRPRPDVIAHSFGTLLLAQALAADESLKVGRVILTGCILRPDFRWQDLIDRHQVEAVLNHHGSADVPVAVTHYFIPDSGPAGRRGFDAPGAINVEAVGFGHSTFFEKALEQVFAQVWEPFLKASDPEKLSLPGMKKPATRWKQSRWLLRAGLGRWAALALLAGLGLIVAGSMGFGLPPFISWVLKHLR